MRIVPALVVALLAAGGCKAACTAKRATKTVCTKDGNTTTCVYKCRLDESGHGSAVEETSAPERYAGDRP